MRTKPPKVKLPGLLPCGPLPPALWATVRVGAWSSQAAWNLAAVSQPSKVEQHSLHLWTCVQVVRAVQSVGLMIREPGKGEGT